MNIETLLTNPNAFAYMERYVSGGSRTYSKQSGINQVLARFQPAAGSGPFSVPAALAPRSAVNVALDDPSKQISDFYLRGDNIVFPVHPQTWELNGVEGLQALRGFPKVKGLATQPTASTRTLFIEKPFHHFVKTHLPIQISRFVRRLRGVSVQFSVLTSRDLAELQNPDFGYLPEVIGASIGEGDSSWGFVVREPLPRPLPQRASFYVPLFSLYAGDLKNPGDLPLLVQLIRLQNADPAAFTLEHIMKPLVRSWCRAYRERGIIFGSHAQNVLLELDAALVPQRIIHRDLDLQVDPAVRTAQQLHSDFPKSRLGIEVREPRERALSLKYDMFMGHHLFGYIAAALKRHFNVDPAVLQSAVREQFRSSFPDSQNYFDNSAYYYAESPEAFNEYALVRAGAPEWR